VHDASKRLHGLDDFGHLRSARNVYLGRRGCGLHMHALDLHCTRHRLPGCADRRDLLGRRKQLSISRVDIDVSEPAILLRHESDRGLLAYVHEQLLPTANSVRFGRHRDLCSGEQRLLGVCCGGRVSEHAPNLRGNSRVGIVHMHGRPGLCFCEPYL
jgi:hypothetical protein